MNIRFNKRTLSAGLALAVSTFCFSKAHAQDLLRCYTPDPNAHVREHNVDMERMLLEVSFEPKQGLVKGNVTHYFKPIRKRIDSIWLDGNNLTYKDVKLDGKAARYKARPDGVVIYTGDPLSWQTEHQVSIAYEARPKKGIYFIGWNDSTNRSRKQIWTQGEETDNRNWIPSYDDPDDKLITELEITLDKKYQVLSNGTKLKEKENKDGSRTWHYRMTHPHTLYLTMIGAGDYAIAKAKSSRGVPLLEWYYPDKPETMEPTYRYTGHIMDVLEREIGVPYPWESYSQIPVQDFIYGAMENTTATIFGDFYEIDPRGFLDRNYVSVNAHEMTHQWFGDYVSALSPKDQWLQESFATFYAKLAERDIWGEDYYNWNRRAEQNTALAASKNDKMPIAHTSAGTARIYQKGSFVLGMLRDIAGEEQYREVIRHYLQKHGYQNVTTYDLYMAFQEVLGQNMDWFFDEWVYRGGEPAYNVRYENVGRDNQKYTSVYIDQTQTVNELSGLFKMPITVEVFYKDGSRDSLTEWVETEHHVMNIPNPANKAIAFVLFDPNNHILKQVSFTKGFDELSAQLAGAPAMLDRYDALYAMRNVPLDKKRDLLVRAYRRDSWHGLREEVIYQLANDADAASVALMKDAVHDKSAAVRLAALQTMQHVPDGALTDYEMLLTDSSYNVVETALTKLSDMYPQYRASYLQKTDKLDGMSKNVRIAWIKVAYTNGNTAAAKELADYAGPSFEFRTRINACRALEQLNYLDDVVVKNLFDAATSNNGRLARPAIETIYYFYKQVSYRQRIDSILQQYAPGPQKDNLSQLLKQAS